MKNLILATLFSFISFTAFAQSNIKLRSQGVYYSYSDASFFGPSVAFEAPLKNRLSLQIAIGYLRSNEVLQIDQNVVTQGVRFEPEIRYYPKGGLTGFFVGARISYTDLSSVVKTGGERLAFPTWGGKESVGGFGGVLGFQTNLTEQFKLGTVFGLEFDTGEGELGIVSIGVSLAYNL
jgi:hypothetical protein